MNIQTIGVLGAGAMGTGIAHAAALNGFQVKIFDDFANAVEKSRATIVKLSTAAVEKGKQTVADREAMLKRVHYATDIRELAECRLVIEAVVEVLDVKLGLFKQLDEILDEDAIIASNTSSMSITALAAVTRRPEKIAGMHFFNPAQVMKLVEVIRGYHTSDETVRILKQVSEKLGKTSIEVKRDTPGFVVNRLLLPQMREAVKILEEGVASIEDIDIALKLGLNHPMGTFALQDLTGIDICHNVLEYFQGEMGDQYAPPLLMKQMVKAGKLGRKTGGGWYDYSK